MQHDCLPQAAADYQPVVRERQGEISPRRWAVFLERAATGDHLTDGRTGHSLGLEYLRYLKAEVADGDAHGILLWIVKDMPAEHTGIEVGFIEMIDFAASVGLHEAERVVAYWKSKQAETDAMLGRTPAQPVA